MPAAERRSTLEYPRLLAVIAMLLLALRIGTGVRDTVRPSVVTDLVHWSDAGAPVPPGKPILYDFSATWCNPCKKMQRQVFADPREAAFINETFAPVRVQDADEGPAALALRAKYRVNSIPTLIVVNPAATPQRREGYAGRRSTIAFLKKALVAAAGAN